MTPDVELMEKATAGDGQAFETLVSRYEQKVYHMALRYTGDQQEALDLAQEVFLRMYRTMDQYQPDCPVNIWIYRIADRVCKDTLNRSNVKMESLDQDPPYDIEIPDLRYNPESVYDRAALRETIVDAVSALPEHLRRVIILREIAGLSYEEIAVCLELELGTVKSRIARGRDKLRSFLSKTPPKPETNKAKGKKGGRDR